MIPVPSFVVDLAGLVAAALVIVGLVSRGRAWMRGELPVAHTLMVLSHLCVFAIGYVAIADIDHGWLTINIWHNAQYVLFVWHINNRQAESAPKPGLAQRLCGTDRVGRYVAVSIVASTVVYGILGLTIAAAVTPVIVYQAINFHHYVTDSRIWKTNRAPATQRLEFR